MDIIPIASTPPSAFGQWHQHDPRRHDGGDRHGASELPLTEAAPVTGGRERRETRVATEVRVSWDAEARLYVFRFTTNKGDEVLMQVPSRQVLDFVKSVVRLMEKEYADGRRG